MDRAYSVLTIKSIDQATRRIRGIATAPDTDRQGDILEPLGARFAAEIPLLLHHNQKTPVGVARLQPATAAGIEFEAELPTIDEPGAVRDEVERAWTSIVHKLMRGVSIGFKPIADGVARLKGGGLHVKAFEIFELSLVTIPAHQRATLAVVKALDTSAATGHTHTPPGVSGLATKPRPHMGTKATPGEQIQNLENKRAALAARMTDLLEASADAGATLEADAATEHDGLAAQVKSIDADLQRWREHEKLAIATAAAVPGTPSGVKVYAPVSVRPNVPLGTAFIRKACALMVCQGNKHEAAEYAKRWDDSTPEVALSLKAAVAPGTTTDATWASPLVNQTMVNDFIELLRPATVLGKIPGLREVPFNCKVPMQTAGGAYGWVGEAKPKPLTKLAFASDTLGVTKVAGIIVLTEELVRLSNPSAEALVRKDMIAGIAQFLDQQFLDPAVAAVAGINPASITNGAPTAAATANPLADIMGLINHFATNNIPVNGVTFVLSSANALALSFRSNLDGSPEFPGIGIAGGSYRGLTFITSNVAGTNVVALQPAYILYADEGGVSIDASREASLQMDSAPMSPSDATTVLVSLFQNNLVALRAERFSNWKRVNANAVKYLTAANWPAPTGAAMIDDTGRAKKVN
ncbi:MAG: phage major capsid protein [Planctomycetota bacterium]|nr:MAG: phage major capsid protein [Planctomycetota bacterium]